MEEDRFDEALAQARELTEARPGEVSSWLVLADMLRALGDADGAMQALDEAADLAPLSVDVHDKRAVFLEAFGCSEEAIEACRPACFADDDWPAPLRLRSAMLRADSGNVPAGLEELKALVADEPSYVEAWKTLVDWYERLDRHDDFEQAVTRLVALAPRDAVSRIYLAQIKMRRGETVAAKAELERVIDTSPAWTYAVRMLVDLHLADGDVDHAVSVLRAHKRHCSADGFVDLLKMVIDVHSRSDFVLAFLSEETQDTEACEECLSIAIARARSDGNGEEAEAMVYDALEQRPELVTLWITTLGSQHRWSDCERCIVDWLESAPGLVSDGLRAYATAARRSSAVVRLESFVSQHKTLFSDCEVGWRSVAGALATAGRWESLSAWAEESGHYDRLPVGLLAELALSLQRLGRDAEAERVSALILERADEASAVQISEQRKRLAHECALRGERDEAQQHLGNAMVDGDEQQACIDRLTEILIWFDGQRSHAKGCQESLIAVLETYLVFDTQLTARLFWRAVSCCQRRQLPILGWLWGLKLKSRIRRRFQACI